MRIELNSFFGVKPNNTAKKPAEKKTSGTALVAVPNEDKLEFSAPTENRDYSLSKAKSGVVSALRADCDPAKLDALKAQVKSGTYPLSPSSIASSILSGGISV